MDNGNEIFFPNTLGIAKIIRAITAISERTIKFLFGLFILEEISKDSHKDIERLL